MKRKLDKKIALRVKRKKRIRKKIFGTEEKPRLTIYKSLNYIYAQIINDEVGKTLVAASTLTKDVKGSLKNYGNVTAAKKVGEILAKKAIDKGIKIVTFDRNGYLFHGSVKALADTARDKGLKF